MNRRNFIKTVAVLEVSPLAQIPTPSPTRGIYEPWYLKLQPYQMEIFDTFLYDRYVVGNWPRRKNFRSKL